jgi:hypothetical protein
MAARQLAPIHLDYDRALIRDDQRAVLSEHAAGHGHLW